VGFAAAALLLGIGAVLTWGVSADLWGVDDDLAGVVLMLAGVAVLALAIRFRSSFGGPFSIGENPADDGDPAPPRGE
jgi:hypothetical protein